MKKISETIELSQNRVSEIVGNTNFGKIGNLLSYGRDMEYIAGHYYMDLPLARLPRLSGQSISSEAYDPTVTAWHFRTHF